MSFTRHFPRLLRRLMKRKTKNIILAVVTSITAIFLPAFLLNKWVEGIIFFICHWLIREQFKEQYHHIIPSMCRVITASVFFFGVSFILPFTLSLFSAIPINYLIGWVGFTKKQADVYELKYKRLKAQLERKSEFSVDNCTEAELVARCQRLGMSAYDVALAIEFFILKTPMKEIAAKHYIEVESVKKRKYRMKNKLNCK